MPQWFLDGGPVMWVILGCSIFGLGIFLERLLTLRRDKILPRKFLIALEDLLSDQKISEAETLCKQNASPVANIVYAGVKRHKKPREQIKEGIEEVGKQEVLSLSKYIGALGTIAHISPLLGLLGTVLGMTEVFQVITSEGVGNAQSLAGGISKALITTVAGLVVAIPTLVAYRYLSARVKEFVTEIESQALKLMDLVLGD
ncbi:MAG: hypothetical protein A3B70_03875 [Deltaproteobacteria bacterium RIFCSPHIGHO2_02_FULL_40_11]|nr:MAG: hypothetical protein A3B70_03875 [Deltaproteobacteria bacterium RIFCSPHIGHO2_02_FULL_40_11]